MTKISTSCIEKMTTAILFIYLFITSNSVGLWILNIGFLGGLTSLFKCSLNAKTNKFWILK